jgi:transposase InsO family protein
MSAWLNSKIKMSYDSSFKLHKGEFMGKNAPTEPLTSSKDIKKMGERLTILNEVIASRMTQAEAANILKLTDRQVRRLLQKLANEGPDGLLNKSIGQPGHHSLPEDLKAKVLDLATNTYPGAGPNLLKDLLIEHHQIPISSETLRQWMIGAGLFEHTPRKAKRRRRRDRKACFDELVQIDSSEHDWFCRGQKDQLVGMIDDATSRLFGMFHSTDSTATNMETIVAYLRRYGRPLAFYSDRASHFNVNKGEKNENVVSHLNPTETQIQRALRECDIHLSLAGSPQAKGRVERLFGTLQNRLLLRMKFEGIQTIEQGNEFLSGTYFDLWNNRFAIEPLSGYDAHRPITGFDLNAIFSIQVTRTVRNDYTISLDNKLYQIDENDRTGLRRSKVIVEKRLDGTLRIRHKGHYYRFYSI